MVRYNTKETTLRQLGVDDATYRSKWNSIIS